MSFELFLQVLTLGCIRGAIYSLIAIGFTLVFGVARVINLAHGSFYMLGAYFVFLLLEYFQLPLAITIIISISLVACLGGLVDFFLIRPMRHSWSYVTIITLSFALLCQYLLFSTLGARHRNIPLFVLWDISISGISISGHRILILLTFIVVISGLIFFLRFARFGKAVVAVSQNYTASILMGITPERIFVFTGCLSASMAALAGIMISPLLYLNPTMWFFPLVKAFAIVILGGMGSIKGSLIAAFILGLSEMVTTMLISNFLENIVSLTVIAIVLLVKPSGLFGARL